jgi:hypothetical protein
MEIDDRQADDHTTESVTGKPKKSRKKRAKPVKVETPDIPVITNIVTEEPLPETTDQVQPKPKKAKSGRKRKTTTKKKTQLEPDLALSIESEESEESESVRNPELGALGQAGVHGAEVEVLSKIPVDLGLQSNSQSMPDDITVSQVITPVVSNNPSFLNNQVTAQITASQNVVLPLAAVKVRNVVASVVDLVAEIIPNKVIVQGVIHEQLFFVGTDGIVHHLASNTPLSTLLDIPQVQPGMNAQVTAAIEDIITEVAPDGLSILKKIVIEVFVKVTETVQINLELGDGPRLLLEQVAGENSAQTLIENDVTLFTPALKIDEITGAIRDVTTEIINDKVIIQGILHKQIFFVDTANLGRHQAEDVPFSLFVDIPGVVPGMNAQVQSQIEAIFFNLVTPDTVHQKAILEFCVKVTENIEQQVTVGTGPLFKVEEFIGENTVQELAENVITLNLPAVKVREIVARLQDFTTHVIADKVIVQGTIHKQIFFIGVDNIEHHQAEDIPFSVFLDIPGAEPGDNVHLNSRIEAILFELTSATTLRQKVIIAIQAIITREVQLNLVLGVGPLFKAEQVVGENTKQVLVVHREIIPIITPTVVLSEPVIFPVEEIVGRQQIIVRNTVELPEPASEIKNIEAAVMNETFNVITDGVVVAGQVDKTVNFIGTDNIVKTVSEEVPFSILVSIPGITSAQVTNVTVVVENISFSLNPTGTAVTQNIVLLATVEATTLPESPVTIVTDVSGPGVTQTKVLVEGLVLTPGGPVLQQFEVVTDVSGPGIISVTKQTVLLRRVGEPVPAPITVVTGVQLA